MEEDVKKIVFEIATYILKLAGVSQDFEESRRKIQNVIEERYCI